MSSAFSIATASACDRSPLLVRDVDVWSPATIQENRDVLISNGRIAQIAPTGHIQPPQNTRLRTATGEIMLPGFIDSHVHFGYPGASPESPQVHPWGDAGVTGPQLLSSGVTSARLHLDTLEHAKMLHEASQDPCTPLPRLQVSGPAFIPGSPTHDRSATWSVKDVDDAIAKVTRVKQLGFEWISIHDAHDFPQHERNAIIDTARRLGLRILASGYSQAEVDSSLQLHPNTIDYLDVSAQPEYDPQLLQRAHDQRQLVWVARLGVHERYRAHQANPALIDRPLHYEFMEPGIAEHLRAGVHRDTANKSSDHSKRMDAAYPTMKRKFEQLMATGIPLAAGTDAGSPGHFHRDAIWWELNAWVKNGATVNQALEAVTANGAKVLGDQAIGHLQPGARADFFLYSGRLLEGELRAESVTMVVKDGVIFRRPIH